MQDVTDTTDVQRPPSNEYVRRMGERILYRFAAIGLGLVIGLSSFRGCARPENSYQPSQAVESALNKLKASGEIRSWEHGDRFYYAVVGKDGVANQGSSVIDYFFNGTNGGTVSIGIGYVDDKPKCSYVSRNCLQFDREPSAKDAKSGIRAHSSPSEAPKRHR